MNQTIHIFKKDVRAQAIQLSLTLLLIILFAILNGGQTFELLLVLAWWILVARLILTEPLVGDGQFWCTRPYRWRSLLMAKAFFILGFVNLPLMIADLYILHRHGFPLTSEIPGLLCNQVLVDAVIILPVAAIATVTTGLAQLLSATFTLAFVLVASTFLLPFTNQMGPFDWVGSSLIVFVAALATVTVILLQYSRRKKVASRTLIAIACGAIASIHWLLPWSVAFAIQSRLSPQHLDPSTVQISFDKSHGWLARSINMERGQVQIQIPLAIAGMPENDSFIYEGLTATFEAPDGTRWKTKGDPASQLDRSAGILTTQANMSGAVYRKMRSQFVTMRGSLYFTIAGNAHETSVPFKEKTVVVPGAGICFARQEEASEYATGPGASAFGTVNHPQRLTLMCRSGFRSPAHFIAAFFDHRSRDLFREPVSYSPFPTELTVNPVNLYFASSMSPELISNVTVRTTEPLSFVKRDFELTNIRLSDFEPQHH